MAELGDTLWVWQEQVYDGEGESSWATIAAGVIMEPVTDIPVVRALVTRKLEVAQGFLSNLALERQRVSGNSVRLAEFRVAKIIERHM